MPSRSPDPNQFGRTSEIEDASNSYFIHPISRGIARFAVALHIHPNFISLLGLIAGIAAAFCYYHYQSIGFVIGGFALMLLWHIFDGADGLTARMSSKTSEFGKILDGVCDYLTFILVYVALSLALMPTMGGEIWAWSLLAGASHIAQAAAYEYQRSAYDYWVHGKSADRFPGLDEQKEAIREASGITAFLRSVFYGYVLVQHHASARSEALSQALTSARESGRDVRGIYRANRLSAVRRWGLLNANNRTFAIFIATLIGRPHYYFIYEVVALNLLLLAMVKRQKRRNREIVTALQAPPPSG